MSLAPLGSEFSVPAAAARRLPTRRKSAACHWSANDVKTLQEMVSQLETSSGSKPSVGQLVSVMVRVHLQGLSPAPNAQTSADGKPEAASSVSDVRLQQMIDEQFRPLREQVHRLEDELHPSVDKTIERIARSRKTTPDPFRLLPFPFDYMIYADTIRGAGRVYLP